MSVMAIDWTLCCWRGSSGYAVKYSSAYLAFFFGVLPGLRAARIDALIGK